MKKRICFGLVATMAFVSAAAARTPEDVASAAAKKRGYTLAQTSCYVDTFKSYARLNKTGGWHVPGGKTGNVYRNELRSRCSVSR